jgi:RNA polymerase sigma-70 factor, ECF subfamily
MSRTPAQAALFKEWLEAYRGILLKTARSFARNPTESVDLNQEMLVQLWNSAPAYSGQAKASTWVYRVCLNTALMWQRGATRRERRIETGVDLTAFTIDSASPADSAGDRELLDKLYAAIQSMPHFDRALVLLMLDDLSYREIAEVTGLSENHVGVALTRARKRLAELMKGITDELE